MWVAYDHKVDSNSWETPQYPCPIHECRFSSNTREEMLQHVRDCPVGQKGKYLCPKCEKYEPIRKFHADDHQSPLQVVRNISSSVRGSVKRIFTQQDTRTMVNEGSQTWPDSYQPSTKGYAELDSSLRAARAELSSHDSYRPAELDSPEFSEFLHGYSPLYNSQGMASHSTESSYPPHYFTRQTDTKAIHQNNQNTQTFSMRPVSVKNASQTPSLPELDVPSVSDTRSAVDQRSVNDMCTISQAIQSGNGWSTTVPSSHNTHTLCSVDETQKPSPKYKQTPEPVLDGTMNGDQLSSNNPYRRYPIGRNSVSSMGSSSQTGMTSRSSMMFSLDSPSSSRATSYSEMSGSSQFPVEGQTLDEIFDGRVMSDEPGQTDDIFEYNDNVHDSPSPIGHFQPLEICGDLTSPLELSEETWDNFST